MSGRALPHAALMDRVYRRQRHFYDATRRHYLLGRDHLIGQLAVPPGGCVLELGCGTGRNLIAAARAYPDARLFGLDISQAMLASARTAISRAGLDGRIAVAQGDATDFDPRTLFGIDGFDRIFFSYALSMIPDWRAALRQACRHVAPSGSLHVVDFGQQENLPALFKLALFAWLGWFHVSPRADLGDVLAGLADRSGAQLAGETLHRGYAWHFVLARTPAA